MKLKRDRPEEEIPTSSMADIAFLLIIYFMVTTTFAATRGLDFALPKEDDSPPMIEPEDAVLIKIQPGGNLLVDTKPMPLDKILEYLKPKLTNNPNKPVIIQPEENAEYGYMVDVYDELRRADEKIGMDVKNITIPTRREIEAYWF